jgi:sterol desaturase/sphingolipid hydroxylase (fatty acid hydroxylase superfamily)
MMPRWFPLRPQRDKATWRPDLLTFGGAVALLAVLGFAERSKPLRRRVDRTDRRWIVNLVFALTGAVVLAATQERAIDRAVTASRNRRIGLLRWVSLPHGPRVVFAIVLLDYTLWAWHLINHRVPLLWRFHAAHHADLDLDVTTGVRFHFGELLLSVPFRALQVLLLGIEPAELRVWESLTFAAILFHHSNLQLPLSFENRLRMLLITPRLHGIHHSRVDREVSSNFGTLFSLWDFLHRRHLWGVRQTELVIGLPEARLPLDAWDALASPFQPTPPHLPRP